jgi:hypothetical protein
MALARALIPRAPVTLATTNMTVNTFFSNLSVTQHITVAVRGENASIEGD